MNNSLKKKLILILVVVLIGGAVVYIEKQKANTQPAGSQTESKELSLMTDEQKQAKYPPAQEIVGPAGFINSQPFELAELIGKKVILVDFWTYSCINCQRTLPYLTSWHEKYKDAGLAIVGIHTPEFEFEKEYDNVLAATKKFGVTYPVVLDNDYATWRAYGNRYWPRKYLIDIDGYIVYDHIGEGAYDTTESKIQELLSERLSRLGEAGNIASDMVSPAGVESVTGGKRRTPEIYFGSSRNSYLGGGQAGQSGQLTFTAELSPRLDRFYLTGEWLLESEFAESLSNQSKITLRYRGQKVFLVAGANRPIKIKLTLDGEELGNVRGQAVADDDTVVIEREGLYRLVEDSEYGEHILEITIENPGLQAFAFTFG